MNKAFLKGAAVVLLFLCLVIWWGSSEAETHIEIGPSQVTSDISGTMLTLTERFNDKYDLTLGYITKQSFTLCSRPDCRWHIGEQIFVGAEMSFVSPWTDKLRLGLGPYYFQNRDRIATTNFRVGLNVEYRFNRRWGIRARHFSNAGTGPDMTICREKFGCVRNNWNTGQDSWFRVMWFF